MKNIVIAIVAVLATAFVNSASAQSVTFGSEKKTLATEVSAEQKALAEGTGIHFPGWVGTG